MLIFGSTEANEPVNFDKNGRRYFIFNLIHTDKGQICEGNQRRRKRIAAGIKAQKNLYLVMDYLIFEFIYKS